MRYIIKEIYLNISRLSGNNNGEIIISSESGRTNTIKLIDISNHYEVAKYLNGSMFWYLNNIRHREDGPAILYPDGYKEWWLNGLKLTENEFEEETQ